MGKGELKIMEKDLQKELKDLLNEVKELVDKTTDKMADTFYKDVEEALKGDCSLSIETKDGRTKTSIEGTGLSILINLASLEKSVMKKLDVPVGLWEMVKELIDTKEADNE